jgi:hypothetical protein
MTSTRPEYVIAVTQAATRRMPPDARKLVLDAGSQGETAGEIVARCQAGEDSANWLIDTDGTVYELAGWERATLAYPDAFVIKLVMPGSDEQTRSLSWLTGQLARKKGVSYERETPVQ